MNKQETITDFWLHNLVEGIPKPDFCIQERFDCQLCTYGRKAFRQNSWVCILSPDMPEKVRELHKQFSENLEVIISDLPFGTSFEFIGRYSFSVPNGKRLKDFEVLMIDDPELGEVLEELKRLACKVCPKRNGCKGGCK